MIIDHSKLGGSVGVSSLGDRYLSDGRRTRVEWCSVAIGSETCLICVRAVLSGRGPLYLTVTDICQTVSNEVAYLHLCSVLDVSELRLWKGSGLQIHNPGLYFKMNAAHRSKRLAGHYGRQRVSRSADPVCSRITVPRCRNIESEMGVTLNRQRPRFLGWRASLPQLGLMMWGQSKDSWPGDMKHFLRRGLDAVDWPCGCGRGRAVVRIAGGFPALLLADALSRVANFSSRSPRDLQTRKVPSCRIHLKPASKPAQVQRRREVCASAISSVRSRVRLVRAGVVQLPHIDDLSCRRTLSPVCQQLQLVLTATVAVAIACALLLAPCPPVGSTSQSLTFTSSACRRARS